MSELTFEALAQEVIRLADESPDYVYDNGTGSGCVYVANEVTGAEACLLGRAMKNIGMPIEDWATTIDEVLEVDLVVSWPHDQIKILERVQNAQDNREPWGFAVEPLKTYLQESLTTSQP